MKDLYIDAKDLIVGRIATVVAKHALMGGKVEIYNCEHAVLNGKKEAVFAKYKRKRELGIPSKGPFQPRMPDRFVRRIIRGMIPYKQPKGKEAFARVMCYIGTPQDSKELTTIKGAEVSKLPNLNYMKVGELCKLLGAKHE